MKNNDILSPSFLRTLEKAFGASPVQVWRSRISWRIALSVFLTILIVQTGILLATFREYETRNLHHLTEIARSSIALIIRQNVSDLLASPISEEAADRLLSSTLVNGFAVYSADLNLIKTFGEPLALVILDRESLGKTYRSADGASYEMVLRPNDLRRPYVVVARVNASSVSGHVISYVEQTLLVMFLMSAFVTSVLMVGLGRWLLEPILFMRKNLLEASKNPENPNLEESPFDPSDEIGQAISIAQELIRQNTENIRRIKSVAEDQIHRLAYYDTLTGLPNRTLFLQQLSDFTHPDEGDFHGRFAVVTLDLDHFKDINDSMGHNIGDAILRSVGKRLRSALPESALVARSGEDEFAIMMPLSGDSLSARDVGLRVLGVIRSEPFKVFNENFQIRASVGASTFPDDAIDPDQVLKNADIALNRAKEEGRDTLKEYSEDFDRAVQVRFQMLRDLRDALEQGQLSLNYQPQFDLGTGKLIGAEALLRWWKPDGSREGGMFISPGEFVPVAEQSGLIVPIGEWVLHRACETAVTWNRYGGEDIRVAVNISGAQFHQGDLVSFVERVLHDSGLPAHRLELEVTESVFMDDIHNTIDILQKLHAIGVELAIDDFGTGYSSLSYLRQFPIDRLKIDQSFIRNALNNPDDASIARTIVNLGHSLNLKVIAEGVETRDHERFLKSHGCDEVQGFRYARPMPPEDLQNFLVKYGGDLSVFD